MQVLFSLHFSSSDWAVLQCLGPVRAGPTLGLPVGLLCLRGIAAWAALSMLPRVVYLSARPKHGVRWFLAFSRKSRPGLGAKPVSPDHYSGCGRWGHAAHPRCPREGLVLIPSPQRGWAAVSTCPEGSHLGTQLVRAHLRRGGRPPQRDRRAAAGTGGSRCYDGKTSVRSGARESWFSEHAPAFGSTTKALETASSPGSSGGRAALVFEMRSVLGTAS